MFRRSIAAVFALAVLASTPAPGQSPPTQTTPPTTRQQARPWHVRALAGTTRVEADSGLAMLERDHLSPDYLKNTTRADRLALIKALRETEAAAGTILVNEDQAGVHIQYDGAGGPQFLFTYDTIAPFRITSMKLIPGTGAAGPALPPLAWDDIPRAFQEAEAAGFSGQLLVRRQGKDVLRATYGMADRAAKRPTTQETIYCIGSGPIDFTVTAIRLLAERGKLSLDDPIAKYLPGVPADKAPMTIAMILAGKSGLQNFHHLPTDADHDLTYIDRATAVKRILASPLLFAPGTRQQHSHSAYGLLAAIVEITSGKTYPEFVRAEILQPLGMKRTGFYGETLNLAATAFATGYGQNSFGAPNIPPNWGKTSWLVMGSGGMVSTLDDLRRYHDAMDAGTLFTSKTPRRMIGVNVDGSDRGFQVLRASNAKGDEIFLMTNTEAQPGLGILVDRLARLVMDSR